MATRKSQARTENLADVILKIPEDIFRSMIHSAPLTPTEMREAFLCFQREREKDR